MMVNRIAADTYRVALPSIRIGTTIQNQSQRIMGKMASGLGLLHAYDSPAGMAISERMRSLILKQNAVIENIDNAGAFTQTADSYLQSVGNITNRMQELAISANDGTKSQTDRDNLQAEFNQLQDSIRDITSGPSPLAKYNTIPLFQGNSTSLAINPEIGQTMTMPGLDLSDQSTTTIGRDSGNNSVTWSKVLTSGESGISISKQQNASYATDILALAQSHISDARSVTGAQQRRLNHTRDALRSAQINTMNIESGIRNADLARESVNLAKFFTLGNLNWGVIRSTTSHLWGIA